MAMIEEAPNVVTEDGLRGLLAEGYLIEVVCKEGAGCTTASIPLVEGARERHAAPGRTSEPRTGPVLVKDN